MISEAGLTLLKNQLEPLVGKKLPVRPISVGHLTREFPASLHQRVVEMLDWVLANNLKYTFQSTLECRRFSPDRTVLATVVYECYEELVGHPVGAMSKDPGEAQSHIRDSLTNLRNAITVYAYGGRTVDYTHLLNPDFLVHIS